MNDEEAKWETYPVVEENVVDGLVAYTFYGDKILKVRKKIDDER